MSLSLLGFTLDWTSERLFLSDQHQTRCVQPLNAQAMSHPSLARETILASPLLPRLILTNMCI